MVDEAHRTPRAEPDCHVRAILPNSVRFGFTGTPAAPAFFGSGHSLGTAR